MIFLFQFLLQNQFRLYKKLSLPRGNLGKMRELSVSHIEHLSPLIKKITFVGDDLKDFNSLSADDHVKIFFPYPGEEKPVLLNSPDNRKPLMRDYTPLSFDTEKRTLDIAFYIHDKGIASDWAKNAEVGSTLTIAGPRGSRVVPYEFDWYFLIGDESFIPSVIRRLKEIPQNTKVITLLEVKDELHQVDLRNSSNVEIHWAHRDKGETLLEAIKKIKLPKGDSFTWISSEKEQAFTIKDVLVKEYNFDEKWMKATGYWQKKN